MTLTTAQLKRLAQLYDEASVLDGQALDDWLAALPADLVPLRATLQQMLSHRARIEAREQGLGADTVRVSADGVAADPALGSDPSFHLPRLASDGAATAHTREGERVGPYRLLRLLGQGGMGTVWLAERADGAYQRQVALKLPRIAWDEGLVARMARERAIAALLEHPSIARLYDAGVDAQGRPYLAMEYIDGVALDVWCAQQRCSVAQRLQLMLKVAHALAHAHARLIVHRDLKPSNILVSADGEIHLLDFGIAKRLNAGADEDDLTQDASRVLTPRYAAPEQISGAPITVATDIYALGVLLFELLTGVRPHEPTRGKPMARAQLEHAVLHQVPDLASKRCADADTARAVRGDLDAILAKSLRSEPTQRYGTADAWAADVQRHLSGKPVQARPNSTAYRWGKGLRRNWLAASAGAAVALALIGGAGVALHQARLARASEAQALVQSRLAQTQTALARAEAERLRAVNAFVVNVFAYAPKLDAQDGQVQPTATELLERAAADIPSKFPADKSLQAQMYGVIYRAFVATNDVQRAVEFGQRYARAADAAGLSPDERAAVRLSMIPTFPNHAQAKPVFDAAFAIGGQTPLSEARLHLAAAAMLHFEQALGPARLHANAARRLLDAAQAPHDAERVELMWFEAEDLLLRGDLAGGRREATQAIDATRRLGPAFANSVIQREFLYAYHLINQAQTEEGMAYMQEAMDKIRALRGKDSLITVDNEIELLRTLFLVRDAQGLRQRTAEQVIPRIRRLIDQMPQAGQQAACWRAVFGVKLAKTLISWGDIAAAARILQPMRAEAAWPAACQMHMDAYWYDTIADLDDLEGRPDSARRALDDAHQAWSAADEDSHPGPALRLRERRAVSAVVAGDLDAARAELALAAALTQKLAALNALDGVAREVDQLSWLRAWVYLQAGEPQKSLDVLAERPLRPHEVLASAQVLEAQARCALGDAAAALPLFESALHRAQGQYSPHAPLLTHLQATAGLCALKAGARQRASDWALQARRGMQAGVPLAPYFTRPLSQLEQALQRPHAAQPAAGLTSSSAAR